MSKPKQKPPRDSGKFDLSSLDSNRQKLHEAVMSSWTNLCIAETSNGRALIAMHLSFKTRQGSGGGVWARYLEAAGIPFNTAADSMKRARERNDAGITEKAERLLVQAGVPLDKPKFTDAALAIRQQVASLTTKKQAEALKPEIFELAQRKLKETEDNPLSTDSEDKLVKYEALSKAVGYLDRYKGQECYDKLQEFCRELETELADKWETPEVDTPVVEVAV